jgi:transposase-like protein
LILPYDFYMEKWPDSLQEAITFFADDENCQKFMVSIRWADGKVRCPQCDSEKVTYLKNVRRWKCYGKHPKAQFSLKVGTIFEDSPLGLDKWLPAAWLICNCKNGISSYELARDLNITQKSCWFMLHRIRVAMTTGTFRKLGGDVEVDETFVGGKVKLMNSKAKARKILREGKLPGGGTVGKAIVMGLLERHGEARVKVVPKTRGHHLVPEVKENVELGANVYTDQLRSYDRLIADYAHQVIDHTEAYVQGQVHTNGMENFWSLFKRTLKGTYVSVEPFHLQAYADEQCFRFNQRKTTDFDRFALTMKQIVGRRLTYDQLIGKAEMKEPG